VPAFSASLGTTQNWPEKALPNMGITAMLGALTLTCTVYLSIFVIPTTGAFLLTSLATEARAARSLVSYCGRLADAGRAVAGVSPGDRVCAILPGGGYAELAAVPADMAMPIPPGLSFEQGAAIPEAFLTAYRNLFPLGLLRPGETVLVHAGGSGVGTAAIQLIREGGGRSLVTAGSPEKISRCRELGAEGGWNYREGPFAPWVASRTSGKGVDIVLDCVGAPYLDQNLRSLARGGRLLVIGMMGGSRAEGIDLARILMNHLSIKGSTLRHLDREEKERLVREFSAFALPRFADGRLVPVVDSVFDWTDAASAHERMESNANVGKIVLSIPER